MLHRHPSIKNPITMSDSIGGQVIYTLVVNVAVEDRRFASNSLCM